MLYFSYLIEKRWKMAYKINDDCANCGACDSECPVEAISEKDGKRWIDPEKCTDCGTCASACPTEAIAAE
jgi:ferredoxin